LEDYKNKINDDIKNEKFEEVFKKFDGLNEADDSYLAEMEPV